MVNPADVHGRCLAMMVWGKKADGTDDVAVFTGTAEWDGQRLVMLRRHGEPPLEVQGEWLDRLKPVDPDLRSELLGAEYYFSVTIGPLPAGDDMSQYRETGLTWPPNEDAS
jgi:hypothetical protein